MLPSSTQETGPAHLAEDSWFTPAVSGDQSGDQSQPEAATLNSFLLVHLLFLLFSLLLPVLIHLLLLLFSLSHLLPMAPPPPLLLFLLPLLLLFLYLYRLPIYCFPSKNLKPTCSDRRPRQPIKRPPLPVSWPLLVAVCPSVRPRVRPSQTTRLQRRRKT